MSSHRAPWYSRFLLACLVLAVVGLLVDVFLWGWIGVFAWVLVGVVVVAGLSLISTRQTASHDA